MRGKMTSRFNDMPIKNKLTMMIMGTTTIVVIIAFLAFFVYQLDATWQDNKNKLTSVARITGLNVAAAITFHEQQSAADTLAALSVEPSVLAAFVIKPNGQIFAQYRSLSGMANKHVQEPSPKIDELIAEASTESFWSFDKDLEAVEPIIFDHQQIGLVIIQSQPTNLLAKTRWFIEFTAGILALIFIIIYFLSSRLQQVISGPILHLVEIMRTISEQKSYCLRVKKETNDEVGTLFDGFNEMLENIETRDKQLELHRENLEQQIALRTNDLSDTNRKLEDMIVELKLAKETAETASKAKSEFLSNMSHEIRTPLHAVLGMTELLDHTELTEEQRKLLTTIHSAGKTLIGLISNILDFSKIEAGKMVLDYVAIDLLSTFNETIAPIVQMAEQKGLKVEICIEGTDGLLVLVDPTRLNQILSNLIYNAVKFTVQGKISVHSSLRRQSDNNADLLIEVTDTGIGISTDAKATIFDSFTQEDGSTTRKYGGTGLGLAITKKLVSLMGGEISIESELGKGSTFLIIIPCQTQNKPLTVEATPDCAADRKEIKGTSILVVEDNADNQNVVRQMLEMFGFRVDIAGNGLQACEMTAHATYDLILMDCQMPVMDGFEATRSIRERERLTGAHTNIVALTGNVVTKDLEQCLIAGMDDYLGKPFSLQEIHTMAMKWLPAQDGTVDRNDDNRDEAWQGSAEVT
jgi:signal transduction histidine kinase/CheY-like chemotaxis protein